MFAMSGAGDRESVENGTIIAYSLEQEKQGNRV